MSEAPCRLPRRPTDRVEDLVAWLLTAAALLVVVSACLTGVTVHGREAARTDDGRGSVSPVRAVLLEDVTVPTGDYGAHGLATVPARWTDRRGLEHTDAVVVTRSARAGTEVAVWIDATGRITPPPLRPVNPVVGGIAAAVGVMCAGATLLGGIWLGVCFVTARMNSRRWERDWARVEPLWRRGR